jgi:hypothetical protein
VDPAATFLRAFVMSLSEECLACHGSTQIDFLRLRRSEPSLIVCSVNPTQRQSRQDSTIPPQAPVGAPCDQATGIAEVLSLGMRPLPQDLPGSCSFHRAGEDVRHVRPLMIRLDRRCGYQI